MSRAELPLFLVSSDSAFAAALESGCARDDNPTASIAITVIPETRAIESARSSPAAAFLIDLDTLELSEAAALVAKLTLLTSAPILVTGAAAAAGLAALDPLVSIGVSAVLLKPQGKASTFLFSEASTDYIKQLRHAAQPPHRP